MVVGNATTGRLTVASLCMEIATTDGGTKQHFRYHPTCVEVCGISVLSHEPTFRTQTCGTMFASTHPSELRVWLSTRITTLRNVLSYYRKERQTKLTPPIIL